MDLEIEERVGMKKKEGVKEREAAEKGKERGTENTKSILLAVRLRPRGVFLCVVMTTQTAVHRSPYREKVLPKRQEQNTDCEALYLPCPPPVTTCWIGRSSDRRVHI